MTLISFFVRVLLAVVLLSGLGFAQDTPKTGGPLLGSEADQGVPAPVVAAPPAALHDGFGGEDGVYRILVVGDGLAGGLGAGLTRMAEGDARFEIVNRFNESSGLARPEVYDWPEAVQKLTADKRFDAVVVLGGVNDRQGIRDGNIRHVFQAPDWVRFYTANVDRLLATVKESGAQLFWISLPPMENPGFDADMRFLASIHQKQALAAGATFVDVRPMFQTADGKYTDRGPDDTGVERKLRSRDGVTFFKQGNNRFGQIVMAAIKAKAGTGDVAAPAPAAVVAPPVVAPVAVPVVTAPVAVVEPPSFGQSGIDGEDLTFRADSVVASAAKVSGEAPAAVAVNASPFGGANLKAVAGSAAATLFTQGLVAPAPAGRFDDFTAPEK